MVRKSNNDLTYTLTNNQDSITIKLPTHKPIQGKVAIDVTRLYRDAKLMTFDPGFMSTASCESKITYINGEAGILEYRGYPIEQLAGDGEFIETAYLLLYGELPSSNELEEFSKIITHHTMLNKSKLRQQCQIFYSPTSKLTLNLHDIWSSISAGRLEFNPHTTREQRWGIADNPYVRLCPHYE